MYEMHARTAVNCGKYAMLLYHRRVGHYCVATGHTLKRDAG